MVDVRVDGLKIQVLEKGRGEPVLFLHGNPDSSEMWRGVIDRLDGTRWRSIAPDLPGFGGSEIRPETRFDLPSLARFVDQLLAELSIDQPVHLVMHDFGGPYGFTWAVEHPHRVRSLSVINTFYFSRYRWHFWARIWRTPFLGELSMILSNWWIFLFELRRGSRNLSMDQLRDTYSRTTPTMRRTVLRLYRATDPENFEPFEQRLLDLLTQRPSQVLWGVHDPYFPEDFPLRYGVERTELFPQSGHWLPAEYPELVADRLEGLFSTVAEEQ